MRLRASEILFDARRGIDVVAVKEKAEREVAQPKTLGELVPLYLKARLDEVREKTFTEMERYLGTTWRPLHGMPAKNVNRQAIKGIISGLEHKVSADRARVALSGLYAWAIEEDHCEANPTIGIKPRAGNRARERVLSEDELVEVWKACGDDEYGIIVKLLILTGQRRTEIGGLEWREIDAEKRQVLLPPPRTKNERWHIVPLPDAALALLRGVEKVEGRRCVFGGGLHGYSNYGRRKKELGERVAVNRGGTPLPAWRLHDLRRSFTTHVCDLGFAQPHVAEAIINHVSGAKAGVAGTYNRALYLEERRQAIERWAAYITGLVDAPLMVQQSPKRGKSRQFTK
jgi:integrase